MPRHRSTPRALPAALLIALAAGCSGGGDAGGPTEPSGAVAGVLRVQLAAPAGRDGAMLLAIDGPALPSEITSVQSGITAHVRQSGTTATVALFGAVAPGDLLRLRVADVGAAASYRVTVREVAAEDNALRPDLSGYRATVARAEP